MEINLEKAKKEFLKYTEKFNLEDENIERKQQHSLRVMEISNNLAKKLNLNQEEIELATLIGLLHDIGRFKQYTEYTTFNDLNSFDHGDYGVEILNKDIRTYIENEKYDEIIKKAIKNHNKYQIEEGLNEKELLFAKIIRDADKLDIFFEAVHMFWKGIEKEVEKTKISENVLKQFENNKQIKKEKGDNSRDSVNQIMCVMAFIYDINFKGSFEILENQGYINKILERFNFEDENTKNNMEKIKEVANNYIKTKIGEM